MSIKLGSVILIALCTISSTLGVPQCACPRQYAPVCGSDGNVYSNKCLLDCKKSMRSDLTVVKEGPCETPAAQCVCGMNYLPVCGTDGVTYSNVCQLRCERQKNPTLEVFEQGACGDLKRSKRGLPYEMRYRVHRRLPCSYE